MKPVLRDYQEQGAEGIRAAWRNKQRRVLTVMPTGAGKTVLGAYMVGGTHEKGKRVLWLTDREELADQASEAFNLAGVPHSYIMAGCEPDRFGSAWVGTIQSFLARVKRGKWVPDRIDLGVLDEAHRAESDTCQQVLGLFPDAYWVGLTATPMRGDGRGLGNTFQAQVTPITTLALMDRGLLVRPRYFIPSEMDFTRVHGRGADFSPADLAILADSNPQLVGDVVENFARICPNRRAVAFPLTIAHSIGLRDAFNAVGISAVHVDGKMPKPQRRELMAAFRSGEAQILTSVNIAIEGLDVPDVSAVILARPTKSLRIFVQAVGRGLRSFPGQSDCVVLDHAGLLMRFGPAEDFVPPELNDNAGQQTQGSAPTVKKEPTKYVCEAEGCCAVLIATNICPECAHVHQFEGTPEPLMVVPGQLEELTEEGRRKAAYDLAEKQRWYAGLMGYCLARSGKTGRAFYLFQEKFKEKPGPWADTAKPAQPSQQVIAFVKSRDIAYARAQQAVQGHGPNRGWKTVKAAPAVYAGGDD